MLNAVTLVVAAMVTMVLILAFRSVLADMRKGGCGGCSGCGRCNRRKGGGD